MRKPFEGIFGNTVELRLLEFLLPLEGIEFNISELTEEAGISRQSVDNVVKKFVEWDVMKISATNSGITHYEINVDSPFFKLMDEINNRLIEKMLGTEVSRFIKDLIDEEEHHTSSSPPDQAEIEEIWLSKQIKPELPMWGRPSIGGLTAQTLKNEKQFDDTVSVCGGNEHAAS